MTYWSHVSTVSTNQQPRLGSCATWMLPFFPPTCHNWGSQSLLLLHFYLTSALPRQLPSPSCFDSVLCDAGNPLDPENCRMRDRNKKKRKLTFKARRQREKVLDRINFVNPLGWDFLRLHGLHLAEASLSPLICHVIGHWALSDHVLETSCLVTTDWDLLYHWHRRLSLSRLLLHHLRVERLCVLHFVYEAVSWVRFPVLAHLRNTEHLPVLLLNWRTCLIYFTYLSARLWHLSSVSLSAFILFL